MGVKNFYKYFRKIFQTSITSFIYPKHDVLMVELNGLFYSAVRDLQQEGVKKNSFKIQSRLFLQVVHLLEDILLKNPPNKKLVLIVDGVAGMMKVHEQKQRRYKNILENKYDFFDLNAFTPGTKLMHHLTKYIDYYLRSFLNQHEIYRNVKIYFSNEKVHGEGEVKLCKFIKNYCSLEEIILIYNSDSDTICLSLLQEHNIIICRNSVLYGKEYINMSSCRNQILERMVSNENNNRQSIMMDFLLLLFLLGNDYMDTSPSIDGFPTIYETILPLYQQNGKPFTKLCNGKSVLDLPVICKFIELISFHERQWIMNRYRENNGYFPNQLYLPAFRKRSFCMDRYKKKHHLHYMNQTSLDDQNLLYFQTLQEYLNICLYQKLTSFSYPCEKPPFLSDISFSSKLDFKFQNYFSSPDIRFPHESFFYLCWILPPQSKYLLPEALQEFHTVFDVNFPGEIKIDLNDKRNIWEGRLSLPQLAEEKVIAFYYEKKREFTSQEKKRNGNGKMFLYEFKTDIPPRRFECYYGAVPECHVEMTLCS